MADNRGTRIPGNQPGFTFGMMPGMPGQYFQPGMQNYPMMQPPMMMAQGVPPQMYPMQVPMVRPQTAPPPYTTHLAEAYKAKTGGRASRQLTRGQPMTEEELRKAQYFQAQQQRLKQFGKGVPQTTFIPDDPTKLVDSIFGTNSGKPKPKPTETQEKLVVTPQTPTDDDDGFGDFMEGPSVKSAPPPITNQHSVSSQAQQQERVTAESPQNVEPQLPPAEKKDLMSMMLQCSDLKQPAKARPFQKPSLKEVHVLHAQNKTFAQSDHARCWTATDELIGLFKSEIQSQPPPKQVKVRHPSGSKHVATTSAGLPLWCEAADENLPAVYRQVLEAASGPAGIETDKLYPILILSGLPREILGSIWQLTNRERPGQVTRSELFAILALIALAQNNYSVVSLEILTRCPQPPVPFLGQNAMAPAPGPADPSVGATVGVVNQAPSPHPHTAGPVVAGPVVAGPVAPEAALVTDSQAHSQGVPLHAGPQLPDRASFAVSQQNQGIGQPNQGLGQPNQGIGQPNQGISQPNQGIGQPNQGIGQPNQGIGQPNQGIGQPNQGISQPNQGLGQPNHQVICQPNQSIVQPSHQGMAATLAVPAASGPVLQSLPMTSTISQPCPPVTMTSVINSIAPPTSVHYTRDGVPQSPVSGFPVPPSQPKPVPGSSQTISTTPPVASVIETPDQSADDVDDDFADFQTAAVIPKESDDSFGDFIGTDKKSTAKQDTLYTVSAPTSRGVVEQVSYEDKYNSNVRSFFCSSDSSTAACSKHVEIKGHTTPNSLEDDFTDCRDSSQMSTSEQSENEDIRVFESYVEEFNRKKDQQNFSPLHRPIARRSSAAANLPSNIPSVPPPTGDDFTDFKSAPVITPKEGPSSQHSAAAGSKSTLVQAAHKLESVSASQPGDDDFSDFLEAPVKSNPAKPSSSGVNLLGDEDKYSALRIVEESVVIPSVFDQAAEDEADGGFAEFEEAQKDDNEWAAFTEAEPAQIQDPSSIPGLASTGPMPQSESVNQLGSMPHSNFLSQTGSVPPLGDGNGPVGLTSFESVKGSVTDSDSKLPLNTSSNFGAVPSQSDSPHTSVQKDSILSLYGSEGKKDDDDWADFEAAPVAASDIAAPKSTFSVAAPTPKMGQTLPATEANNSLFRSDTSDSTRHMAGVDSKNVATSRFGEIGQGNHVNLQENQLDKTEFTSSSQYRSSASMAEIMTVKKTNLPSDEIMGVFKMREDPSVLARLKRPTNPTPEQTKSYRMPSQESDIDDDRLPPPMDFPDEEEDHNVFSRGYDGLDEIVNKPVEMTSYNPFGVGSHLYTTTMGKHGTKIVGSNSSSSSVSLSMSSGSLNPSLSAGGLNPSVSLGKLNPSLSLSEAAQSHISLALERPDDNESCSSKEQDNWTWKDRFNGNREDSQSLSSLDLNHRVSVHRKDSDSGGTDSQSVSSAEFTNFEALSREQVESKSVDSLDLKTGPQAEDDSASSPVAPVQNTVTGSSFGTVPAQNLVISGRMRPLADRYNIGDDVQDNNNHEYAWERCLDNCCRMIQDANTVFNSVSSSAVCNEVIRSTQGSEYVTGVIEIYKVVCRIMATMMSAGIKTPTLEKLLKEIDLSWNNLTAFLMGASILPDPNSLDFFYAAIKCDSELAQEKSCGVCLLNVDAKNKIDDNGIVKLMYGGRQYHAPCANFWVNCVDSTLPALRFPELL